MNTFITKTIAAILVSLSLVGCHTQSNEKKIGIIVPIQHKAMDDITNGFEETLRAQSKEPLKFKVANAQADLNLQRAIIQQMRDEDYDLIVPIGTDAGAMTASIIQDKPIVSLASSYTEEERIKHKPCHVAVLHDEIPVEKLITFLHQVYPAIKNVVLVHSAAEKIYPDVKTAVKIGNDYGMQIKPMLVSTLNELYTVANAMPDNTQAILVLKDSLIVSGIGTLALQAEKRHIPLITSDQGSVQDGAAFALGVHERDIGVEGAKLAAQILAGKPACSLPIVMMTKLTVFVNPQALGKENQSIAPIEATAKKNNYAVETTGEKP